MLFRLLMVSSANAGASVEGRASTMLLSGPRYSLWSYLHTEQRLGLGYFLGLFIKSTWGVFGWLEIFLPTIVYIAILLFCLIGLVAFGVQMIWRPRDQARPVLLGLLAAQVAFVFLVVDYLLSFAQIGHGLGLQGRYFYPVLAPVLFVLLSGWSHLFHEHPLFLRLAPLGMLALQLFSLATIIARYYGVVFG
jgi:uncharacterized membrane protein